MGSPGRRIFISLQEQTVTKLIAAHPCFSQSLLAAFLDFRLALMHFVCPFEYVPLNTEMLPLRVSEHEAPIHHPRNAVVNRRLPLLARPFRQPSRLAHVAPYPPQTTGQGNSMHFVYPFE
jgi:hypothetical protein